MQIAYSQYADQDVLVKAGFNYLPERKFFLCVTFRNDDRMEDDDPRDFVYDSYKNPELDWTSIETVLGVLEKLSITVPQHFFAELSKEHEGAARHLDIFYADDYSVLPF